MSKTHWKRLINPDYIGAYSLEEGQDLKPCPFCGAAAHFAMDADRWEWVECESCGMQGNRRASLMDDCKPMLAEAWNRRAAPRAQKPLTDEQLRALHHIEEFGLFCDFDEFEQIARAIEHAHGIKSRLL